MGRELRRKEAKRNKENIKEMKKDIIEPKQQIHKMLKILIITLIILIIFYLIVAVFITKEIKFGNNNQENANTITNNRSNILVSEIFKQSEETYYVYFYDFNNTITSIDNALISKLYDYKIYKVDMSSGFNTKYSSEIGNSSAKSIEELKIVTPTLIYIENDKITKYVETETNILKYING